MGNCVAGGAYLPVLCDTVLMTEGSGLYLAGPALVKAAIGQDISHEDLGGADVHAAISGTVDYREPDDDACLERLRRLVALLAARPRSSVGGIDRRVEPPARPADDLYRVVRTETSAQYDVRDLLACLLDGGPFDEYRAEFGQTLVCGFGRLGGNAAGGRRQPAAAVPARRRRAVPVRRRDLRRQRRQGRAVRPRLQPERVADPLHPGRQRLRRGPRRRAAAGSSAAGRSWSTPSATAWCRSITLIVGHSFGAGHYALCGKAFDPRFLFAWPGARYAVMGAEQAARTMLDVNVATLKRQGKRSTTPSSTGSPASCATGTTARPTSATPPPGSGSTRSSTRPGPARS